MISYSENLKFDVVTPDLKIRSRAQFLKACAGDIAEHICVASDVLLKGLNEKHRMDRACVGGGLAIYDLKVRGMRKPFIMLATLAHDVEFGAPDDLPVNVVCFVFSPEKDGPFHLRRLSRVTRLLKDDALRCKIAGVSSESVVRSLLGAPAGQALAA